MGNIPTRLFPMGAKASAPLPPTEFFTFSKAHSTSRPFDAVTDTDLAVNAGNASVRSKCVRFQINDAGTWTSWWYKGSGTNIGWRTFEGGVVTDTIPVAANQEFYVTPSNTYTAGATGFTVTYP